MYNEITYYNVIYTAATNMNSPEEDNAEAVHPPH